jgi:hypothetical protein
LIFKTREKGGEMGTSISQVNLMREKTDKVLSFAYTGKSHSPSQSKEIVEKRERGRETRPSLMDEVHPKNLLPDVGVG